MRRALDSKTKSLVAHRAQLMRTQPTQSEQKLWLAIRSGQLGVPFRRQYPIGRFIVDFVALKAMLVVEVDGPYHLRKRAADARRDRRLARLGYRVLRIEAGLVVSELQVALGRIRRALG